jgi:ArsR family transcriptional regulator, lead/cadmium/zinc/bismuth-responsive transcriptional repressor
MSNCSYIHMSHLTAPGQPAARSLDSQDPICDAPHLDAGGTAALRARMMAPRTVEALADTFRVLGDPTRVRILDALSGGELCVCDIAAMVGISESAVSHQLRLLRGMRLVRPRRAGRQVYYAVDDQHILELLRQGLTHVEESSVQFSADSSQRDAESRESASGPRTKRAES